MIVADKDRLNRLTTNLNEDDERGGRATNSNIGGAASQWVRPPSTRCGLHPETSTVI